MDPTPSQKKHFLLEPGTDYGTFSFDRKLPKLPVPTLDQVKTIFLPKYSFVDIYPIKVHKHFFIKAN